MVGKANIGSLHNVPAPSAGVLNEALKLLSTFGDSKGLSKLLEQMREVQTNNQRVFTDAQTALAELRVSRDELEHSKVAHEVRVTEANAAVNRRLAELTKAESLLNSSMERFSREQAEANAEIAGDREAIERLEQNIQQRETACARLDEELTQRANELDQFSAVLDDRARQLESKERKLRAALNGE